MFFPIGVGVLDVKHRIEKFHTPERKQTAGFLDILLEAAIRQQAVVITYGVDPEGDRVIQPIGIYEDEGFWFCPAFCYKRKAFRLFRADRIRSAARAGEEERPAPVT
ncbi:helix-turn-helix transcriptional regulator [Paenibacillus humicola]|uniref:helix-turn-helix transcriptional regulator n=1 Tax=Paenibacillus humicola TaxID=3110540 RepID=UPI003B837624